MNEQELERLVDRQLKAIPPRSAPGTLLPSVMREMRARAAQPWYARPWFTWPAGWQTASIVALVLVVGAVATLTPVLQPVVAPVLAWTGQLLTPASDVVATVGTFTTIVEVMSRVIGQSIIGLVLAMFVVMLTTSVAIGAAIGRVAVGE